MKTLTTLILRRPSRNQHMQKPSLKSNSYFFSSNCKNLLSNPIPTFSAATAIKIF